MILRQFNNLFILTLETIRMLCFTLAVAFVSFLTIETLTGLFHHLIKDLCKWTAVISLGWQQIWD